MEKLRRKGRRHSPRCRLVGGMTGCAADLSQLRIAIDTRLRTRRFLDYWESSEWAVEAAPVVDAIGEAVAARPSAEILGLVGRSVGHMVKVILRADDSNGEIGNMIAELLELHWLTCDAGFADPMKLARWMVRLTVDDQDFFVLDPKRYAAALGDTGLVTYRKEIERRRGEGSHSYSLRYVDECLAVLDGDVDKVVCLLGGNLTNPYQFTQVTEAMVELGRDDDALAWAKRGIAETNGWQVAKLYDLAAEVYLRRNAPGKSWHFGGSSIGACLRPTPTRCCVRRLKEPASGIRSALRPGLCWRPRSSAVWSTRSWLTGSPMLHGVYR